MLLHQAMLTVVAVRLMGAEPVVPANDPADPSSDQPVAAVFESEEEAVSYADGFVSIGAPIEGFSFAEASLAEDDPPAGVCCKMVGYCGIHTSCPPPTTQVACPCPPVG